MPTALNVASLSGHMTCANITHVTRENLVEAAEEFRRRKEEFDLARKNLQEAMYEADQAGMAQTEIIKISGYTREHVRRIVNQIAEKRAEQGERDQPTVSDS
ncbi:MAG: hypothetical protein ACRDXB_10930 [Actinomycetes bacterium]